MPTIDLSVGSGAFPVYANDSNGTDAVNGVNNPITVRITATGMWNFNRDHQENCDADGLPTTANETKTFKMPKAKAGSLLLYRKQPNYYQRIGTLGDIILYPGETVAFVCNDANHSDNYGYLNINWELVA